MEAIELAGFRHASWSFGGYTWSSMLSKRDEGKLTAFNGCTHPCMHPCTYACQYTLMHMPIRMPIHGSVLSMRVATRIGVCIGMLIVMRIHGSALSIGCMAS